MDRHVKFLYTHGSIDEFSDISIPEGKIFKKILNIRTVMFKIYFIKIVNLFNFFEILFFYKLFGISRKQVQKMHEMD
jgi:hypothetical protein